MNNYIYIIYFLFFAVGHIVQTSFDQLMCHNSDCSDCRTKTIGTTGLPELVELDFGIFRLFILVV